MPIDIVRTDKGVPLSELRDGTVFEWSGLAYVKLPIDFRKNKTRNPQEYNVYHIGANRLKHMTETQPCFPYAKATLTVSK